MPSTFDPASSLYTHQVVIDFTADGRAFALLDKWYEKHAKGTAVRLDGRKGIGNVDLKKRFQDQLKNKRQNKNTPEIGLVKIYIVGHSSAGSNTISGNKSDSYFKNITIASLVNQLTQFIQKNDLENKVVINLTQCGGAQGDDHQQEKSFAEKLHVQMKAHQKNVPVIARKGLVNVRLNGRKETIGSNLDFSSAMNHAFSFFSKYGVGTLNKASGSKLTFDSNSVDSKDFYISDAYERSWARSVFKMLEQEIKISKHEGKKAFLEKWKTEFKGKTDEYIFNVLKQALDNSTSPLHARSGFSGLFYNSAKSAIGRLIETLEKSLRISTRTRPEI